MKLISTRNYEIDNGIEAIVEKKGEKLRAYLQLPECADSEHSLLDCDIDPEIQDKFLAEIVELVESKHTQLELCMLEKVGELNPVIDVDFVDGQEIYTVTDSDGVEHKFQKSAYSDYYNALSLERI